MLSLTRTRTRSLRVGDLTNSHWQSVASLIDIPVEILHPPYYMSVVTVSYAKLCVFIHRLLVFYHTAGKEG